MARRRRAVVGAGSPALGRDLSPAEIAAAVASGSTPAARWLFLGRDGRLTAYCSVPQGVARWTETEPGSTRWIGPELFPVEDWAGRAAFSQGPDGYVYFAGMRYREDATGGREIVLATQFQTGRPLSEWRVLGNPFRGDDVPPERLGDPFVAADTSGALHLFIHCFGHSVRTRRRDAEGNWEPWAGLDNRWVRTPLVAVPTSTGSVQALAMFSKGAVHWARDASDTAFRLLGRPAQPAVDLTHTGLETGPGSVTFYWRHAADGTVVAYRLQTDRSGPSGVLTSLGGGSGEGPVAAVRASVNGYDCTVLAQRGADGAPEVAAYPTEGEVYGTWWAPVGEPCIGRPAVQVDGMGRVVLAVIRPDGTLWVARQDMLDPGLAFEPWREVG
ncbi:hypothetical protein ACIQ7Q_26280 [Streptomyces sp. NPDC096176]|uniref:hypothetical protein n=1 Tax=Streptomyces sp. NPDC096176 TaxID=3366079 RepID=UPI00382740D6